MHELVQSAAASRRHLTEAEAYQLLSAYGFTVPEARVVSSPAEALRAAGEIGYPVALKVCSPAVLHKSDVGGVVLGVEDDEALEGAFGRMRSRLGDSLPEAADSELLVVPMAEPGLEVIVGMTRDEQFGPALMFGLGGVWVELLKDVTFRLVPVSEEEARRMISEIKGAPLLEGYRGDAPRDEEALVGAITGLSKLVEANPAVSSIDVNPLVVYEAGSMVVDAKVLIEGAEAVA
jgi:acetyl-CoA synthetase (ADP-forming)